MTETKNELMIPITANAMTIFTPEGSTDILKQLEEKVKNFIPDISSEEGRKEIASMAYKIARSKTALDNMGKALVEEDKKRIKLTDIERSKIWDGCEALQKKVRSPLDEWEAKNAKRIKEREDRIQEILVLQNVQVEDGSEIIAKRLEQLIALASFEWEEFLMKAESSFNLVKLSLESKLDKAKKAEQEKLELERLRKEQAEREIKEREERIAKEAADKAQKEAEEKAAKELALAAEKAENERKALEARNNEIQEQARKDKAATEAALKKAEDDKKAQELKAESDKKAAAEKAEKDKQKAIEDERQRVADQKAKEEAETKKREENLNHRKKINNEAVKSFVENSYSEERAIEIVTLIAKGLIKNITVTY